MSDAVATENHNSNVAIVVAIVPTSTAFITLVDRAGLSGPLTVGNIDGTKAS